MTDRMASSCALIPCKIFFLALEEFQLLWMQPFPLLLPLIFFLALEEFQLLWVQPLLQRLLLILLLAVEELRLLWMQLLQVDFCQVQGRVPKGITPMFFCLPVTQRLAAVYK